MNNKKCKKILNVFAIIQLFLFIFQKKLYSTIFPELGNCLDEQFIYYTKWPFYLLIINVFVIIIVKLYFLSKKEKYNMGIQIIVLCIFLVTFLFHAPFEYLNRCEDSCYSASQRYDYMLTMTTVISDEGDMCDVPFDGRYLYIPILNKLIILDNEEKLKIKDVEHKKGDKYYYIDGNKYLKSDSWEVIS